MVKVEFTSLSYRFQTGRVSLMGGEWLLETGFTQNLLDLEVKKVIAVYRL
jgi:hypothetical protein